MIKGIGVDIVKISRIKISHARRILSERELEEFKKLKLDKRKIEFLAGRFSCKEAIIKALGNINKKIGMRDITIINSGSGMPLVIEPVINDTKIFVSISHEIDNCVGFCIIENV